MLKALLPSLFVIILTSSALAASLPPISGEWQCDLRGSIGELISSASSRLIIDETLSVYEREGVMKIFYVKLDRYVLIASVEERGTLVIDNNELVFSPIEVNNIVLESGFRDKEVVQAELDKGILEDSKPKTIALRGSSFDLLDKEGKVTQSCEPL